MHVVVLVFHIRAYTTPAGTTPGTTPTETTTPSGTNATTTAATTTATGTTTAAGASSPSDDCPDDCRPPTCKSGANLAGGDWKGGSYLSGVVNFKGGVCTEWCSPLQTGIFGNVRYCGPTVSKTYSGPGGIDCRKCVVPLTPAATTATTTAAVISTATVVTTHHVARLSTVAAPADCPTECQLPVIKSGKNWNGGSDLVHGLCVQWASAPQTGGVYDVRYCGPKVAEKKPDTYSGEGGVDCHKCAWPPPTGKTRTTTPRPTKAPGVFPQFTAFWSSATPNYWLPLTKQALKGVQVWSNRNQFKFKSLTGIMDGALHSFGEHYWDDKDVLKVKCSAKCVVFVMVELNGNWLKPGASGGFGPGSPWYPVHNAVTISRYWNRPTDVAVYAREVAGGGSPQELFTSREDAIGVIFVKPRSSVDDADWKEITEQFSAQWKADKEGEGFWRPCPLQAKVGAGVWTDRSKFKYTTIPKAIEEAWQSYGSYYVAQGSTVSVRCNQECQVRIFFKRRVDTILGTDCLLIQQDVLIPC